MVDYVKLTSPFAGDEETKETGDRRPRVPDKPLPDGATVDKIMEHRLSAPFVHILSRDELSDEDISAAEELMKKEPT